MKVSKSVKKQRESNLVSSVSFKKFLVSSIYFQKTHLPQNAEYLVSLRVSK